MYWCYIYFNGVLINIAKIIEKLQPQTSDKISSSKLLLLFLLYVLPTSYKTFHFNVAESAVSGQPSTPRSVVVQSDEVLLVFRFMAVQVIPDFLTSSLLTSNFIYENFYLNAAAPVVPCQPSTSSKISHCNFCLKKPLDNHTFYCPIYFNTSHFNVTESAELDQPPKLIFPLLFLNTVNLPCITACLLFSSESSKTPKLPSKPHKLSEEVKQTLKAAITSSGMATHDVESPFFILLINFFSMNKHKSFFWGIWNPHRLIRLTF
ncbi:hypothetical protein EGR_02778 [Echinococcus granulosus]|uniref:Uncharacterized protein n=1 Tax=Echinococcus granulosus TaxID=6210 RepID=W6ULD3_ECHGR|nr:hypothetical protein EGR_02778 [Echinococcus granulosus]EUB62325.1 hypothetical protein EGR_02778 [Echinococcus granulosus]